MRKKERIQKFLQIVDTRCICIFMNDLDKTYLHHDMDYIRYKDLVKKTESNKVLRVKTFKIAIDAKYDSSGRGLVSIVYKFLIRNLAAVVLNLC